MSRGSLSLELLTNNDCKELGFFFFFFFFFLIFWPSRTACGVLVPQPGITSVAPALEAEPYSLDHQEKSEGLGLWAA